MFFRTIFAVSLLLSLPALAQTPEAPAAMDAPSSPDPATADAPPPSNGPAYTEDTPVEKIAADKSAREILNKDIPGLLSDGRYPLFKSMSLKAMSEASDGDLSQETVDKTVADLQALFPH